MQAWLMVELKVTQDRSFNFRSLVRVLTLFPQEIYTMVASFLQQLEGTVIYLYCMFKSSGL